MPGGIQHAVDSELGGVAGLKGADAVDEANSGAGDGTAEVAAAGVEGEVLAPGAALAASLLVEEELRGGREVVEVSDGGVEVLVGVVESGLGIRV